VAITAYSQILENTERSTSTGADEPKGNRQLLTMLTQMQHFFFFIYIMQI
jgi:hypothetical protein